MRAEGRELRGSKAVSGAGVQFPIRAIPRGGIDRIDGVIEGVLRVRTAAPPVHDAANEALARLLARELGVPPSMVRIVAGSRERRKWVSVAEVDVARLAAMWPGLELRRERR